MVEACAGGRRGPRPGRAKRPAALVDTMSATDRDLAIVGAGPAGLSCGIFAARNGLDACIVHDDGSILQRNAIVENFLGFPDGVDSRLLLDMGRDQAELNGCRFREGHVDLVERLPDDGVEGFRVELSRGVDLTARRLVAASWADASYLEHFDPAGEQRGSKWFFDVDDGGRTSVDGLYAAGRIADKPHQAIVNAGHGAEVALAVIHDSDVNFYHDWVAPEGYFTDRDRDVPPGCEEVPEEERLAREQGSLETMQAYFAEPHNEDPTPHPSLDDE